MVVSHPTVAPDPARPSRVELVPGELWATVHRHTLVATAGSLPCWTAVTDGLATAGQREVAITVVRPPDESAGFPPGILGYLAALLEFARQGRIVTDGDVSGYRPPGPFGFGPFVGVAFGTAQPIEGVPLPDRALAGVLLTEGELAMAMVSTDRVLSRLSQASRWYPWPFWSDPARTAVYQVGDSDQSILSKLPRANRRLTTAELAGNDVTMRVARGDAGPLAAHLASGQAVAVLPGPDPSATGALVWSPGQREPLATTAELTGPQRLSVRFVALVPVSDAVDTVRFQEDGFAILLSPATLSVLVDGLRDGTGVRLSAGDEVYSVTVQLA